MAKVSVQNGVSVSEVAHEMEAAIDDAWDNPDPTIRARQETLFPNGKPSIENFIRVMAKQIER